MNIIKKIRRYLTIRYARNCYERMVNKADALFLRDHENYYVCIDPTNKGRVTVFNRREFRTYRRRFNDMQIRLSQYIIKETRQVVKERPDGTQIVRVTRENITPKINTSTMVDIKNGCFYHTRLKSDSTPENIEMKRLAYIQYVLDLSEKQKNKKKNRK